VERDVILQTNTNDKNSVSRKFIRTCVANLQPNKQSNGEFLMRDSAGLDRDGSSIREGLNYGLVSERGGARLIN